MLNAFIRFAAVAAVSVATASGAHAFYQRGDHAPQVVGSGENQSAVPSASVMGSIQPRAIISGTGENQSVEHLDVPAPVFPGYVARLIGSGENVSVVHVPPGG